MEKDTKVKLNRTVNLFGGVSILVSLMIGTGIFISPKGVLLYSGSIGLNLFVWLMSGIIAMLGGLCYAELGTLLPESGGDWLYIYRGLGAAPAFLRAWITVVQKASSGALVCLASAEYLLVPFFDGCGPPNLAEKNLAVVFLWLIVYLNTSTKLTANILKVLFVAKVMSLVMIIIGGIYWISTHSIERLKTGFQGTTDEPWGIALAFYSGLWAFGGWDNLNCITEEIKRPKRTLPAAIIMSITLVIVLYLLANISYLAVLSKEEILNSDAVAVDWGKKVIGSWATGFAFIVSLSTFGTALGSAMTNCRTFMAVSREGHTIQLLSMVDVNGESPLIALFTYGIFGTCLIMAGDIGSLINFFSFTSWLFYCLAFISLLVLRVKRKDDHRPFKVPIVIPIFMVGVAIYLILVPIISKPELPYLYAVVFMVGGLIFYFPFVMLKLNCGCFDKFTVFFQLLFRVVLSDKNLD